MFSSKFSLQKSFLLDVYSGVGTQASLVGRWITDVTAPSSQQAHATSVVLVASSAWLAFAALEHDDGFGQRRDARQLAAHDAHSQHPPQAAHRQAVTPTAAQRAEGVSARCSYQTLSPRCCYSEIARQTVTAITDQTDVTGSWQVTAEGSRPGHSQGFQYSANWWAFPRATIVGGRTKAQARVINVSVEQAARRVRRRANAAQSDVPEATRDAERAGALAEAAHGRAAETARGQEDVIAAAQSDASGARQRR